jgi:uncharacterized protein (DUF433 family)
MSQSSPEKESTARATVRPRAGLAWTICTWGRLFVGLGLIGEGASLYAHAQTHVDGPAWCIGAGAALLGALLSLSGVRAIQARSRALQVAGEPAMPKLGAILVYKYQVLTEEQLEQALEEQREEPEKGRRLGEILLDLGFIGEADLQKALEYQKSHARARQDTSAGRGLRQRILARKSH